MSPGQARRLLDKLDLGGSVDRRIAERVVERNCYLREFFVEHLPAKGAVIDIGAEIGCFAVLALELLAPELLVAFEPERSSFELLVKNLAAARPDGRVETVQTAPWSSATRFPNATLDRQLDRLGLGEAPIRLLRIRARGAESEVLEGGVECLRRTAGLVGEIEPGAGQLARFRALLEGFVVAIGAPAPPAGLRPFWALREGIIPAERRQRFLELAELAALRESLWLLTEERLETSAALASEGPQQPASLAGIERRLRLDRDVIEWQKGSLVRLRRDHDAGLRRSEEMNAALHLSLAALDERLVGLGRQIEAVEASVERTAELARELARQGESALQATATGLGERLDVLGRRLNTLQESARLEPDLAQPLLASKPWRAYVWLGRTKRALARRLAPLVGPLRSAGFDQRAADQEAERRRRRRRARGTSRHRALLIDRRLPTPDRDAASLRIDNLITLLQETRFDVGLLPYDLQAAEPYAADLRERGVEVLAAPGIASVVDHLENRGGEYDLAIVSRSRVATGCIDRVRAHCPRAKLLFDTVELESLRDARRAELEDSDALRETAAQRRREELRAARQADLTLVVSQAEKELLARDAPEIAVHVLSTIHEHRPAPAGFAARRDLLFLADFEQPQNVDAAAWLVEGILPAIRARLPEARLHLVGNEPPERVRALASTAVLVAGFVPDLATYLSGCRVAVAPLPYGAGVMAKATQAMSYGLPCVTTTIGAEGIGLVHGADAMVADGDKELADCVARVYESEALWRRLSEGGLDRVRDQFSFAAARRSLEALLEIVGHPRALQRKLRTAEFGSPD